MKFDSTTQGQRLSRFDLSRRGVLYLGAAGLAIGLLPGRGMAASGDPSGQAVIGCTQEAVQFHPLKTRNDIDEVILLAVFNPLWRADEKGALVPELAVEVPSLENGGISEDGLEWTVKLRGDVTWHDGTPFTAEDVKFSLELLRNPDFPAAFRGGAELITEITVVSPTEVRWKMSEVYSPFLSLLSWTYLVPKHVLEDVAFDDPSFSANPIGTGAFKFGESKSGDYIQLKANTEYFGDGPYLETIVLKYIPDATVMKTHFIAGAIDAVTITGILPDSYDEVENTPGLKLFMTNAPKILGLQFNLERPQFTDLVVRKALYMAMDKQTINEDVFLGSVTPTESFIPIQHWAYKSDLPEHIFDPEGAAAMLDEAGWTVGSEGVREKDGVKLEFTFSTTTGHHLREQTQLIVQQNWSDIGVQVDIQNHPSAVLFGDMYTGSEFDMILCQITYVVASDPDVSVRLASGSIPVQTGSGMNVNQYSNSRVDALLKEGTEVLSREDRRPLYYEVQDIVRDELAYLPLHLPSLGEGTKETLEGYVPSGSYRTGVWNLNMWRWIS